MKVTSIVKPITDLFTYIDYCLKARRIRSDWAKVKAEWKRIGGFHANTEQLLKFLRDFSLYIVEYATWTPTTIDDQIAAVIASILTDHRDILEVMIDTIRSGREISATQLSAILETVSISSDEYGSPMTTLYIISMIYHALVWLKSLRPDGNPVPDVEPVPLPKRPVITFIRKTFNKR